MSILQGIDIFKTNRVIRIELQDGLGIAMRSDGFPLMLAIHSIRFMATCSGKHGQCPAMVESGVGPSQVFLLFFFSSAMFSVFSLYPSFSFML